MRMLALYLDPAEAGPAIQPVASLEELRRIARLVSSVHLDERISRYIVDLVSATRKPVDFGLSCSSAASF